jgi:glyoxylase-like metal-dependent hydrolase (beta-lactamase superfamily II)
LEQLDTGGEHSIEHVVANPMREVDARIHRFTCGDEVDTYAIVTRRFLVVVDTHSTPALARELAALVEPLRGERSLLVVNTHADYDHAWGNQVFAAHPILGHVRCAERLRGPGFADERARFGGRYPGRFDEVTPTPPTVCIDGPAAIHGGDLTLEFVPTPGHTDDHLALFIPELRLLLAGDAAEFPWPHVDSPGALAEARASLELLEALEPALVLPCHGGVHDGGLLRLNLAYLDAVTDDPDLALEDAAALVGTDVAALRPLYREFHADACRAARADR